MARQLKKRPWSEGENAYQWFQNLVAKDKTFQTAFLSNIVIAALLGRIGAKKPKEARFLKQTLALLAAAERITPPAPQAVADLAGGTPTPTMKILNELCMGLLETIRWGSVPRAAHDLRTVSDQRKRLLEYFEGHEVQPSLTARQYKTWLMAHGNSLYEPLTSFDCLCRYCPSLDGITEDDLWDCRGPGTLIEIVLAKLHRSTRSYMRKLLKRSAKQ